MTAVPSERAAEVSRDLWVVLSSVSRRWVCCWPFPWQAWGTVQLACVAPGNRALFLGLIARKRAFRKQLVPMETACPCVV